MSNIGLLNITLKRNKHLGAYYFKSDVLQPNITHTPCYQRLFVRYRSMSVTRNGILPYMFLL